MSKVILLSTGGTIASVQDPDTGLMMAGKQTGDQLLEQCDQKILKEKNINVMVESVFQVPSNCMNFLYCKKLVERMEHYEKNQQVDGFVITHGTDTLEETAYFISLFWKSSKPVILTGAQFSPTERNTDAFHNITSSILVAGNPKSSKVGVVVVFNDQIFSAQYVKKTHTSNIDGFSSRQTGPLGIVDFGRVHYFSYPLHHEQYSISDFTDRIRVEILKSYMGLNPDIFNFFRSQKIDGLVVEAHGRGHVSPSVAEAIGFAIADGIPVVITSECGRGEVAEVYGFPGGLNDLIKKGAINGRDYDAKKARIKLTVLLDMGFSRDELQEQFDNY